MKFVASVLAVLALAFAGCAHGIKVPPGSLTSWTHVDNYGPFQSKIMVTGVEKLPDGTFILGHYDGQAGWLGFGPHDVIEGLHLDASGQPVSATPSKLASPKSK